VDVDWKLFVELAVDDLWRGRGEGWRTGPRQEAELAIGLGRGALDHAEGADEAARHRLTRDRKVEDGTLRGRAIVGVGRDVHLAHRVALHSSPPRHAVILEFRWNASSRARHRIEHRPYPGRRRGPREARGRSALRR